MGADLMLSTAPIVVIGVAGFTGVFLAVLAMATGLTKTFVATGDPARAIVLAKSAQTEGLSNLPSSLSTVGGQFGSQVRFNLLIDRGF